MSSAPLSIGIVGGGMAGLYSALLLQTAGHKVHIFEGTDRVGGRVHTHYFNDEGNQYFEAGAMRIPHSPHHNVVFQLVKYLRCFDLPADKQVEFIPYNLNSPGNFVYVNHHRCDNRDAFLTTPGSIDWPLPLEARDRFQHRTAGDLMLEAINPLLQKLQNNFVQGFSEVCQQYDNYSFRYYLNCVLGWPTDVVDFLETITSQTNQFTLSVTEIVMEYIDFSTKEWSTIANGMSRLPLAMAHLVGYKNVTLGARVTGLRNRPDGTVTLSVSGYNGTIEATFDKVIIAIPPPALKMIADRPAWSGHKELAIRSIHFEPLFKMGLRFKTRFWERVGPRSCHGGQSTTDLPIRWIVYPSNGIGEDGPGVLLVYSWMSDATAWLPLTPEERRALALANLAEIYNGLVDTRDGSTIDVHELVMATSDAVWSARNSTGDAMFLPGQFLARFEAARAPEGNVHFAGEHLSYHHTWIAGALESARETVSAIIGQPVPQLGPFETSAALDASASEVLAAAQGPNAAAPPARGCEPEHAGPNIDFVFRPHEKLLAMNPKYGWKPVQGGARVAKGGAAGPIPLDLGSDPAARLGVELARLPGPHGAKVRRV
ncbi:hypothetical protein BC834DRAFT_325985 [Gloeopeniophorella convolvens]|nr:hypothetical protein BC834DRAFT_325985 [Gloeopeniophorella convolvens]